MTRICLLALAALALFGAPRTQAAPVALPLVADFELDDGGFTPSSATSWKWGAPTAGPAAARSGSQVWGTNLTSAQYSNSEDAVLTSPALDLTGAAGKAIVVHWWQYLVTEQGYDAGFVEVSKDNGGTWEALLGPRGGAVNATWAQQTALLDPSYAVATFRIRFRLVSDGVPSVGGFFIDDLRISATSLNVAAPLQTFETNGGGYVASGPNSSWAYGTLVSAPGGAYSGTKAWATNLNGFYNAGEDSALTSPVFDLSTAADNLLIVTWRQFLHTEEAYDLALVEVSKDAGATWAAAQPAESGSVNVPGWTRRQAFVDGSFATAEFRIRFRLTADDSFQFDGWAIDDVAIFSTTALFPTAGDFTKSTAPDLPILFSRADFTKRYTDPDGGTLTAITVVQVPATGTLALGGVPVVAGQTIPAGSLGTLTYDPPAGTSGSDSFKWRASNFFGSSGLATVTVTALTPVPQIAIVRDPEAATVNPATQVTFSVTAVSSLPLSYQWRRNQAPIDGATSATYSFSAAEALEGDYDVIVTNTADQATSAPATLSVNDPVNFTQHPASVTIDEGGSTTLSVAATATGRLDYQWRKGDEPIPNATFASLTIADAKESDAAVYTCVVTSIAGAKASDPATVTVRLKPRIAAAPISRGIVSNGQVRFTVQATGAGPFSYQWLKDGVEIPGANEATLLLRQLLVTNEGEYSVRVTNSVGFTESEAARLQVFQWPDVVGTYQDVLEHRLPAGTVVSPYPGRVTATVAPLGKVTVALEYLGITYRFIVALDSELLAQRTVLRAGQSPLDVTFSLDPSTLSLSTTVTHIETADTFTSDGKLPRHRYHAKRNVAPQRGRYTVLLETAPGSAGPEAPGYLTAKVSPAGSVVITGKLPDGESASCGALVQFTGRMAYYRGLYPKLPGVVGELSGRLNLPTTAVAQEVDGDLAWRKPAQNATKPIPAAFFADIDVIGSRYVPPARGQQVIAFPLGKDLLDLDISGPVAGSPLQRWVRLSSANAFASVPASAERINFTLTAQTGQVQGGFTDPATKRTRRFEGVVLQAQGQIGGMLQDSAAPGTFLMVPVP